MKKYNYVYITTNLLNGKQYVGSHATDDVDDGYLGSGRYFLKAIKKHGKQNFSREVLQECETIEEARYLEREYIQKFNTLSPAGYNLAPFGGVGFNGAELSQETKDKISKSNEGREKTPEWRANIGKSQKGRISNRKGCSLSQETIDLIRKNRSGITAGENHPLFNTKRSKKTRDKISKSLMGFQPSKDHRKNLSVASLNVKKIKCDHCGKEFTPWGFSRHKTSLENKYII